MHLYEILSSNIFLNIMYKIKLYNLLCCVFLYFLKYM